MDRLEALQASILLTAVNAVLDQLEEHPTVASVRRRRYFNAMWGVVIRGPDEDWLILWEAHPTIDGDVLIQYLGPDIGRTV